MAIIAFASQKGGVGKSTLCRALAVEAIRSGLTTVVSDLDAAQGTSTNGHATAQSSASSHPSVSGCAGLLLKLSMGQGRWTCSWWTGQRKQTPKLSRSRESPI